MQRGAGEDDRSCQDADELLEEILADAHGDAEQLWAFHQVFQDAALPADGFVLGEPVLVIAIDYDGNERRGLTAECRREDGDTYVVGLAELRFAEAKQPGRVLAAYRECLNLDPLPPGQPQGTKSRRHKAAEEDIDLDRPVELIALAVMEKAARCKLLGSERTLTLRTSGLWNVVPGQVITVQPRKQWRFHGHPYLSGEIQDTRVDAPALGLVPLQLREFGAWDPKQHEWGDEGEPIEQWAEPLVAAGPRAQFEMEQVLPGDDPNDPDTDPILLSIELKQRGEEDRAREVLTDMLQSDLRSLDAHAHLGNLAFERSPREAIPHYEVGFRIGELSLGDEFGGVLPWGLIDNRPFLRCMHSFALCLWRLDRHGEASRLFERALWLNPTDNQGSRFLLPAVRAGESWHARHQDI